MAIFDLHHPWLFVSGVLGNIISIFVYLAPLPTFTRIYRAKSTMGYQSVPYIVALFSAMLWLYYAFLKENAYLLIFINSFGCFIETIYITIFLLYASKGARRQTVKLLVSLIGGLYSLIFLVTLFLFNGSTRVQVVGWVCVAVSVAVFAAPLSIVFQVVRTKSVEFMPFTLSFFLTLSAIMWFSYGLLQRDFCIALPNILGFFLGMLQMLLYGMYKNVKPVAVSEKDVPEHVINMVALAETSDQIIHPKINTDQESDDVVNNLKVKETTQASCESSVTSQLPLPVANGCDEDEERLAGQMAQVNLPQQQLVVCAA